jgi:3',5'-cyclic AMP phosphodiesterase CpdA
MVKFVIDPAIAVKINKMKQRVRWQESALVDRGIDQTRLVLEDGKPDTPEFSFMVIGDSGSGVHLGHNPQRQIAEQMLPHQSECRFTLHTGDVVYLLGSSEYYPSNFIEPYREFLLGGDRPHAISYDQMVFTHPMLLVPGNHDYYDLFWFYGLLAQATAPLRRLLQFQLDLDVGLHGSFQGKAYAQAFLDYLLALQGDALQQHLDRHYTAKTETGRCLRYEPGHFTRLPNRYYTFRYGGIDFFALDSNTFNSPIPLPRTREGDNYRRQLEALQQELEQEEQQILAASAQLHEENWEEAEQLDDLSAKLAQIEEVKIDITKQLSARENNEAIDQEQLDWLQKQLITSWHNPAVRGRVIYFHHPPYVTEATKWKQAQTLAVRRRLRSVLDVVAQEVRTLAHDRPLVDLILNGHAHCLEHLRTTDTGHADSHLDWVICGGSGHSLRRQRPEGAELMEAFANENRGYHQLVAKSQLYVGRQGQGIKKRRPYSFLRIDVQDGVPPKFILRPFICDRVHGEWGNSHLAPFMIGGERE